MEITNSARTNVDYVQSCKKSGNISRFHLSLHRIEAVELHNLYTLHVSVSHLSYLFQRKHIKTSSISVECKPPACREYGLHKI